MKTFLLTIVLCLLIPITTYGQTYFLENFDNYTAGSLIGPQSTKWIPWGGVDGGADDAYVMNTKSVSGSNSLYIESALGQGPQDIVMDFGGVHDTGHFKFSTMMYVPANKSAYFNFQAASTIGVTWAIEFSMHTSGYFDIDSYLSGTYPQGQWFEIVIDVDLNNDRWEVFFDGVSKGYFTNTNSVSFIDVFPSEADTEFWMDDITYCTHHGCNPDIEMQTLSIDPVCTGKEGDVTVKLKNNGPQKAPSIAMALDVAGQSRITTTVGLNKLAVGKDTTITIPNLLKSNIAGMGLAANAITLTRDMNAVNDTGKTQVNILQSPSGSEFTKGTPFTSPNANSNGTLMDPDIVADNDVLTYEITAPWLYNNSSHGTSWTIASYTVETVNGTTVAGSNYSSTAPSVSSNAVFSFAPDNQLTDSMIVVSVSITDGSCDTSFSRYIYVAPRPVADFTFANVCDMQQMTFTNTSTISVGNMIYKWDFGDGQVSTLSNPSHLYSTYGTYTVKLFATSDKGIVDSSVQQVEIYRLPEPDFDIVNACAGDALAFNDSSFVPAGTTSYLWRFGDGNTGSTVGNTSNLYASPGTYPVDLIIEVNGCKDSLRKFATQYPRAVPSFNSTTVCNVRTVNFSNTTTLTGGTYGSFWKFGDGNTSSTKNAFNLYPDYGAYDITLIITTDFGCIDSVTNSVALRQIPTPQFSVIGGCAGQDVSFVNNSLVPAGGTNTYIWNFGDGSPTDNTSDPVHNYTNPGNYSVSLYASHPNGCSGQFTKTVVMDEKPVVSFTAEDNCIGTKTYFVNTSTHPKMLTYSWVFETGMGSVARDTSVLFSSAGSYDVTLYVSTASGCMDSAKKTVNVFDLPIADFTYSSAEIGDGSVDFSAQAGTGYTYQWIMGDGKKNSGKDIVHRYFGNGNFNVRLEVTSAEGCIKDTTQTVNVNALSVSDFAGEASLKLYPNPTQGKVFIDLENTSGKPSALKIFSVRGQLVLEQKTDGNQVELDLQHLADGLYHVVLYTDAKTYHNKLIVGK